MKHLRFTFIALATCALAAASLHAHAAKVIYAFGQVQAGSDAGKGPTASFSRIEPRNRVMVWAGPAPAWSRPE
jgi:hypothetical protein